MIQVLQNHLHEIIEACNQSIQEGHHPHNVQVTKSGFTFSPARVAYNRTMYDTEDHFDFLNENLGLPLKITHLFCHESSKTYNVFKPIDEENGVYNTAFRETMRKLKSLVLEKNLLQAVTIPLENGFSLVTSIRRMRINNESYTLPDEIDNVLEILNSQVEKTVTLTSGLINGTQEAFGWYKIAFIVPGEPRLSPFHVPPNSPQILLSPIPEADEESSLPESSPLPPPLEPDDHFLPEPLPFSPTLQKTFFASLFDCHPLTLSKAFLWLFSVITLGILPLCMYGYYLSRQQCDNACLT